MTRYLALLARACDPNIAMSVAVGLLVFWPTPLLTGAGQVRVQVGLIAREPIVAPPATSHGPVTEGWPTADSTVHWVARVLNLGNEPVTDVSYAWYDDGEIAQRGVIDLPPGTTELSMPWRWTFARHRIGLTIEPSAETGDDPTDNQLVVDSNALALDLFVGRGTYDWMNENARPGFERMFQGQIEIWHRIFERGVYPTTPGGVVDRIRLNRVVVLEKGERPVNGQMLDSDLHWYFPDTPYDARFLHVGAADAVVGDQTIVLHELLHQRGLIDLYAYDVIHSAAAGRGRVEIEENGRRIVGTFLMPPIRQGTEGMQVYAFGYAGMLMGATYRPSARLSEHCVNGLNLWAGRRTPLRLDRFGNLIDAWANDGHADSYTMLLPTRTDITLSDSNRGTSMANATVDVYLDHDPRTYDKTYRAQPDFSLIADDRGMVALPGDRLDGLPSDAGPKPDVIVFGVRTGTGRGFAFLSMNALNLLYFRTGGERGELTLPVKIHPW